MNEYTQSINVHTSENENKFDFPPPSETFFIIFYFF